MKVLFYSVHSFEIPYYEAANSGQHEITLESKQLNNETADLAKGYEAISIFSNDDASALILKKLKKGGVKFLALRSAGYNHVDLKTAQALRMRVARVPAYSPYAIAEHAVALMLALNRKIVEAVRRIKSFNFSLDGLTGFDMNSKTVGIIGVGKIGRIVLKILDGMGCRILGYDIEEDVTLEEKYNFSYCNLDTLLRKSDIITLHCPLNEATQYIINEESIEKMKKGVMLINTGRGKLLDTEAVIRALKSGKIGYLGLDVYEREESLFFYDRSDEILQDDVFARLLTFKNVVITGHQAFLTETALKNIATTTFQNLNYFSQGIKTENELIA